MQGRSPAPGPVGRRLAAGVAHGRVRKAFIPPAPLWLVVDQPAPVVLEQARGYAEIFRLVKRLVERRLGRSRAGLMLGLSRLGLAPNGFLGGYYVLASNAIVLNRDALDFVEANRPEHVKAYAFHVLLHEYLHTLGFVPESVVRPLVHEITAAEFPADHPATVIAAAMTPGVATPEAGRFFRSLVYPEYGGSRGVPGDLEIVAGFDPDATPYIG